jgi:type IV secretory pathway VirB2 component (pilin)
MFPFGKIIVTILMLIPQAVLHPIFWVVIALIAAQYSRAARVESNVYGQAVESPLSRLLTSVLLGVIAGFVASLILILVGVTVTRAGVSFILPLAVFLMLIDQRFLCFSYAGGLVALKPEFEGHIQMANPASSGTAYNVIATVVQLWGEEKAFEYLRDLHKNISQYTKSGSAPGKNAAIGETPVGIGYAHDQVKLISEGYPLVVTFPSEGTGFEVASISLVKGGPNPELAKKLVDWALTERAAKIYAAECVVPFVDVPLMKGAIPISQVNTIDQDDVWAADNKDHLIERWQNEIYRR